MARRYVFADEAGNFDCSSKGSRFFIPTSIVRDGFDVGDGLLRLRHDMGWRGVERRNAFHATTDAQAVRGEVFALIAGHDVRIDATIREKAKPSPHRRQEETRFSQTAWYR